MIGSLSARRAWIEISGPDTSLLLSAVALRKESVDRNLDDMSDDEHNRLSLSARRAWIEIGIYLYYIRYPMSRSPQGERG